ncbi:hypothetical protein N5E31_24445 [Pseudomonas chengduensis]|nr:hypothetical protein [Pseudomonas chengduensis]MDH1668565.1 hypothetical protein [Pseudomonas chengduensis]
MSKRLLKTGLAVAITATSGHGFASGFALNERNCSINPTYC